MLNAVLAGLGLAYMPEQMVQGLIAEGRLKRVLEASCEPYPGCHFYYPSQRRGAVECFRSRRGDKSTVQS